MKDTDKTMKIHATDWEKLFSKDIPSLLECYPKYKKELLKLNKMKKKLN